ncbi:hypothetical protein E1A91_D05G388900v1 [Gossypium mustelinum]|uniref:Uncharacterized protein n=3 Tax=Gossypium TaxID=3633 RepID=A0A5J5RRT9_GOSBA|nr:hypothetical protein ES319_D05G377600v1 [Gossypium barbadense]PPD72821.1 hypothetical protein GOBAR_DD30270 [Gossypium barbadense]TYG71521.1 hypothetical protein ES288_D05G403400v1 [Gossypium darwinii]TYI84754.1 hypothetical protein E1A91_D05G388900v1 [Gossypium mustelinum]
MATFKLFFTLCLHAFFLIPSSGIRLFPSHPFSISDQTSKDQKLELNIEFKKFSVTTRLSPILAVRANEGAESEQFRSNSKHTLMKEAREAIKASIERNAGNPLESKRLSPGGPDPHHH